MATFMERLSFLQKVPTLMKATADDECPCPGYLFQEIGKISHESLGYGQCLLEYLLERLQVDSCHVKLKVLKIFVHLCEHGSNHFLTELRRNSTYIQQASVYSGPPDPIHGIALYQKVRNTAQDVARLLFTDTLKNNISRNSAVPQAMGMGSAAGHRSAMQGFGYSPAKLGMSSSDSFLNKIQKAAEVVASAVLPPTEHQGLRLHDNHYRAVVAPTAAVEVAVPACSYNLHSQRSKVTRRSPGQVGGGWDDVDGTNSSSRFSSRDVSVQSRASGSKSCDTGSQSGASKESSGDLAERVESLQLGDCVQEVALVCTVTSGSRVFLSREESQHFIKESSTLNCEVVVDLLSKKLQDPSSTVKMRTMCALSCLMTSDLLSLEQIFVVTQSRLYLLSEGPPGAVANKATKLLRQFEALTRGSQKQEAPRNSHFTPNVFSSTNTDPLEQIHVSQTLLPTSVTQTLHEGPGGTAGTHEGPGGGAGTHEEPGGGAGTHEGPGGAAGTHEGPGGAAGTHEEPGGAAGTHEEPGGAAGTHEGPGGAAGTPEEPGGAAGTHEGPGGVAGTHEGPGGAAGTHEGPGGAAGTHEGPGGAAGTHEGPGGAAGTLEVKVRTVHESESCPSASELHRSDLSRPSLFSGMELVMKSRPVCVLPVCVLPVCGGGSSQTEQEATEETLSKCRDSLMDTVESSENSGLHCTSGSSEGTQTASAFSFLNS